MEFLLAWIFLSMVVWFIWACIMRFFKPNHTADNIITLITAIVGLPFTLIMGVSILILINIKE